MASLEKQISDLKQELQETKNEVAAYSAVVDAIAEQNLTIMNAFADLAGLILGGGANG